MKLLLDIGNTRIKWAYAQNGELLHQGSHVHRGAQATDAVSFVAGLPHAPDSAAAVNVAGATLGQALQQAIRDRFAVDVQWVRTAARCGDVLNGYTAHEQLGADRWAAIVGAWQRCRDAVCIVDAGTAVTIDLLDATGQHQGGFIVPGLGLMRRSLLRDTSDIDGFVRQSTGDVRTTGWLGTDTHSAVERGVLFMLCAAVDKAAASMAAGNKEPRILLTGGDASLLAPCLRYAAELRPLLVLEGLNYLAAESHHA